MLLGHSSTVVSVRVLSPSILKRISLILLFGLLYVAALYFFYITMGEPHAAAVEHAILHPPPEDEEPKELPSEYLPSAWAIASLLVVVSSHILFHLMCHWSTTFHSMTLYSSSYKVTDGCWVHVKPHPHHGQSSLSKLKRSSNSGKLYFSFQRQNYIYYSPSEAHLHREAAEIAHPMGSMCLLPCPVELPIEEYMKSQGLTSRDVEIRTEEYGKNCLTLPTPRFLDLYKNQLLSPLSIFQFFTAFFWMLDAYWKLTLFNLFNVLLFESTTAFQRLRTMITLKGMSTKPYNLKVYRNEEWIDVSTEDLVPGDLFSLKYTTPKAGETPNGSDIVPCDCVLLRGNVIVNEATLTGESVPQMKDALKTAEEEEGEDQPTQTLDITSRHRVHVLFSGTSVMSANLKSPHAEEHVTNKTNKLPETPDDGCLCYVLRTGFNSSQGELIQMIEFSTQQVTADSRETFVALLVLLVFALCAAAHVLNEGLKKGDRTTHELLIKCVIIITSVVPRQLPMQMALAVNTALMCLMQNGIFCTEPYRVPTAGKISHCLFDKTGTLTTDQLVPVGVVLNDGDNKSNKDKKEKSLIPVHDAKDEAALVLAACHSLVFVEGVGLVGDPIELAGLQGVEWKYNATTQSAQPGDWEHIEKAISTLNAEIEKLTDNDNIKESKEKLAKLENSLSQSQTRAKQCPIKNITIVHRYHFSSQLQRMSVICKVQSSKSFRSGKLCLVKGSPEAIRLLLSKGAEPSWFQNTYQIMAEQGMRVLALAYKWSEDSQTREQVESDLSFAGFIAFSCHIRSDSGFVIQALQESNHKIAMVTGDAPLTALHVAEKVNICHPGGQNPKRTLMLVQSKVEEDKFEWVIAKGEPLAARKLFNPDSIESLKDKYDLMVTEVVLESAASVYGDKLWDKVDNISVFARMSPQGKARVIRAIQKNKDNHILMCGDGGNDVGALKQADVGIALLSGYGNANTGELESQNETNQTSIKKAEDVLNQQQELIKKKSSDAYRLQKELAAKKQKELMAKQQEWLMEEIEARRRRGEDVGVMAHFSAMKNVAMRMRNEMQKENQILARTHGNVFSSADDKDALNAALSNTGLQIVRPGDASVAAPFTTRVPSVKSVVDLIRQGRCTLLSALQQQQIMILECVIQAYTMSALSLEGSRSSERQVMATTWLMIIATLAFSYSTPITKMHPVPPLRSLFHPAIWVSIVGQAVIHLFCMVYAVRMATESMGPELLKEVALFHKKAKAGEAVEEVIDPDDPLAAMWSLWSVPFMPNLLNTVVFLVETSQVMAVLLVNYKGRPWMKGVLENQPLALSLFICITGLVVLAWSYFPELNALIHLAPFPDDAFRVKVIGLVGLSFVGTLVWDRLITLVFASKIFKAMLQEALETKPSHLMPLVTTAFKILAVLFVLGSGNLLLLILGGYYMWQKRKNKK